MGARWLEQWEQSQKTSVQVGRWGFLRKVEIQALAVLTAYGIGGCLPPLVLFSDSEKALSRYAGFTVKAVTKALNKGALREERLYEVAHKAGKWIGILSRNIGGLRNNEEATLLVQLLYRNIGIRMEGSLPGEFQVKRCYFSWYYSPELCRIMSNIDNGIVCGTLGNGNLIFRERITEGFHICTGCVTFGNDAGYEEEVRQKEGGMNEWK